MNNILFFEGHEVETIVFNGQALFNAKHIADILDIKNINDNIRNMSRRQVIKLTNSKIGKTDFRKLHNTGENFFTPSGIYKVAFKSHKPNAEKFTDWIADEVLPSIAENGYYISTQKDDKWLITRIETKKVRNEETDMIKRFILYAEEQGSTHANNYYTLLTNVANNRCGIKSGERDKADQKTLLRLKSLETLIEMRLETLMNKNLPYKEVFKGVKELIENI